MKRASLCLIAFLCLYLPTGCVTASSTTPPAALAPGYNSVQDQTFGQTMAALRAGDAAAVQNYATLTPSQQAAVKAPLNTFTMAVNTADTIYLAYHAGTATAAQASAAILVAQTAQTQLNTSLGAK